MPGKPQGAYDGRSTHTTSLIFLSFCPRCFGPVSATGDFVTGSGQNHQFKGGEPGHANTMLRDLGVSRFLIRPDLQKRIAPEHLPKAVLRAFEQADDNAQRKSLDAAAVMYRKAIQMTTKGHQIAGKNLKEDIDTLVAQQKLPPQLGEWAHFVRLEGNDAVHDEDEPSEDEVSDLGAFTRVFLEYVYTLPKQMELRLVKNGAATAPAA